MLAVSLGNKHTDNNTGPRSLQSHLAHFVKKTPKKAKRLLDQKQEKEVNEKMRPKVKRGFKNTQMKSSQGACHPVC